MGYSKVSELKVGDEVLLCTTRSKLKTKVLRVTKTRCVVEHLTPYANYQTFRRKDGKDFGPMTQNVYFLKDS